MVRRRLVSGIHSLLLLSLTVLEELVNLLPVLRVRHRRARYVFLSAVDFGVYWRYAAIALRCCSTPPADAPPDAQRWCSTAASDSLALLSLCCSVDD